jgi:hypothetical protein
MRRNSFAITSHLFMNSKVAAWFDKKKPFPLRKGFEVFSNFLELEEETESEANVTRTLEAVIQPIGIRATARDGSLNQLSVN